jgi:hypothetical protein
VTRWHRRSAREPERPDWVSRGLYRLRREGRGLLRGGCRANQSCALGILVGPGGGVVGYLRRSANMPNMMAVLENEDEDKKR